MEEKNKELKLFRKNSQKYYNFEHLIKYLTYIVLEYNMNEKNKYYFHVGEGTMFQEKPYTTIICDCYEDETHVTSYEIIHRQDLEMISRTTHPSLVVRRFRHPKRVKYIHNVILNPQGVDISFDDWKVKLEHYEKGSKQYRNIENFGKFCIQHYDNYWRPQNNHTIIKLFVGEGTKYQSEPYTTLFCDDGNQTYEVLNREMLWKVVSRLESWEVKYLSTQGNISTMITKICEGTWKSEMDNEKNN